MEPKYRQSDAFREPSLNADRRFCRPTFYEAAMFERRNAPRTILNETGSISVDEHRSLPCIVYDRSVSGVRIALPEAEIVPDSFVLSIDASKEILVCRAVWRKAEEIGATTDQPDAVRPGRLGHWRELEPV
ncbi:PilZ domain-containing protein [Methylobacterium sp. P31]